MGKICSTSGTSKRTRSATNNPSSSSKVKKSLEEKLTAKQNIKFKSKLAGPVLSHGSSQSVSPKGKKKKLQKDVVIGALTDNSLEEVTTKRKNKLVASETVSKNDAGLSPRRKRKRQVHEEKGSSSSKADDIPERSTMAITDLPLSIEMPKSLDELDTTLSELNTTSEIDISTNMDTSDEEDSSPALPSPGEKSKCANVPLAVKMPVTTPSQTTVKAKKEKLTPTVEKPVAQSTDVDQSRHVDNSQNDESFKSNESKENNVEGVGGSRRALSERDRVSENVKVHLVSDTVVLQLSHPIRFYIFGQVEVQVLNGRIRILGYEMSKHSGAHQVSSLRGSSFLSIQTSRPGVSGNVVELPAGLQDEAALKSLMTSAGSDDVWVLLKEGNQDFLEYIQTYLGYPIAPREIKSDDKNPLLQAQQALNCVFHPEATLGKKITELATWKGLADAIIRERNSCTVLCGGKGVGKSTLLRYLVNRVLCSGDVGARGVVVLDFDPGQAELTPPGCVAVSLIKTPLLGPNYTHLRQPERCVCIGEISVTQCLGRYMEAVISIIQYWRECPHLANLPCIVNTMGFTQGIGVTIMGQVVKLVQPTRVVQIESRRQRENYPFHLTKHEVIAHARSTASLCIRESLQILPRDRKKDSLNYELVLLQSGAEAQKSKDENVWGMKPKTSRDAVILSYFASLVQPPLYSLLDDIPYSCPLGTLFLGVTHENVPPNLMLAAVNGNMVALCTIDATTADVLLHPDPDMPRVLTKIPIAPCIGFGIVRGVDMHAKMLYLTTPLQEDKLCLVNCLLYGVVNLPTSVNIKSTAPGLVPYVSSGHHPDIFTQ